jgi:hypothetical protein
LIRWSERASKAAILERPSERLLYRRLQPDDHTLVDAAVQPAHLPGILNHALTALPSLTPSQRIVLARVAGTRTGQSVPNHAQRDRGTRTPRGPDIPWLTAP